MQGQMYMVWKWESHWGMDINISDRRGVNIEMWVGSIVRNNSWDDVSPSRYMTKDPVQWSLIWPLVSLDKFVGLSFTSIPVFYPELTLRVQRILIVPRMSGFDHSGFDYVHLVMSPVNGWLSFEGWRSFFSQHHINHDVFNPLTAKVFSLNFYPLEVVSRWRDPQLQVSENYSDLTKWR